MAMAPVDALTCVQEQIQQLTTAVQALGALQQEDYINVQPQDTEYNPFAEHERFELPVFHGGESTEDFLDWMVTVEETLEFIRVPLDICVPMVAMRFRSKAAAWWSQLKTSRARLSKPRILSWYKLKKKMRKTFLPFNYDQEMLQRLHVLQQGSLSVEKYYTEFFSLLTRVDLQESDKQIVARFVGGLRQSIRLRLNLLNPLTLPEAHQQALTVEAILTVEAVKQGNMGNIVKNSIEFLKLPWWGVISLTILVIQASQSGMNSTAREKDNKQMGSPSNPFKWLRFP